MLHENNPTAIDDETPEIVTYYNRTEDAVNKNNKLCESYSLNLKTTRWPLIIFFSMLNMAGINSQVILTANGVNVGRLRIFLKKLGEHLVKDQLLRREKSGLVVKALIYNYK